MYMMVFEQYDRNHPVNTFCDNVALKFMYYLANDLHALGVTHVLKGRNKVLKVMKDALGKSTAYLQYNMLKCTARFKIQDSRFAKIYPRGKLL